jgi:hypothetical protein
MKRIKSFLGIATMCCLAATSQATLLIPGPGPGSTVVPAGPATLPAGAPDLIAPFGPAPVDGDVFSWVRIDPLNALGGLSFYYQVNNLPPGIHAIERFTATGFAGLVTDVTFIPVGVPPTTADRSDLLLDVGDTIGFNFPGGILGPNIPNGASSAILVIHTSYVGPVGIREGGVIDGVGRSVDILAPVPEPTTMVAGALLLLPFALSTVRRMRKNRTA